MVVGTTMVYCRVSCSGYRYGIAEINRSARKPVPEICTAENNTTKSGSLEAQ